MFFFFFFLPNYPPISIPFLIEKYPILSKLNGFYNNLLKIHPIYVFGLLCLWWKPTDCCTKLCKKSLWKAGTCTYIMSMWERPPPLERGAIYRGIEGQSNLPVIMWCELLQRFLGTIWSIILNHLWLVMITRTVRSAIQLHPPKAKMIGVDCMTNGWFNQSFECSNCLLEFVLLSLSTKKSDIYNIQWSSTL